MVSANCERDFCNKNQEEIYINKSNVVIDTFVAKIEISEHLSGSFWLLLATQK